MNPINKEAYQLLHDGALSLGVAERNGIRMDIPYCQRAMRHLESKEAKLSRTILDSKAGKAWKKMYGSTLKLGAVEQLRDVLKEVYDIRVKGSLDKGVLATLDVPLVKQILPYRKYVKARSTYLQGIINESIDGYLHPNFNLHTASTYRSSSSNPNFQNIPIRDPFVAKLIRRAFIPRPGNRIVEADYSGIEVRVAACYHKDPRMMRYLETGYDMHREMAAEIFQTKPEHVSKMMRYAAKNRFVFPIFYGSYYMQMGPDLWDAIDELSLTTESGVPIKSHLKQKGIHEFSAFRDHIKEVEDNFWNKKFRVYGQWKKKWWERYLKQGEFSMYTGFVCRGHMKKNEAVNFPIQGSAFHCLLWSFITLTKELQQRKMKAKLIGQIHDSIVADVPDNEMDLYLRILKEISTERIREHWDWLVLPLEIEVEATEVNRSWYTKKEITI